MVGNRYVSFPLREHTSIFVVAMLLSCKAVGQLVICWEFPPVIKKCLIEMKDADLHFILQCGFSS